MKVQTILAITAIVVLFAVSASLVNWNQTAEAAKAAGVKNNQYGQNTKDIVCGDRLCSEITSEDGTLQVRGGVAAEQKQTIQNYNINAIMNRMDAIHEQHQRHMIEMWNSMSYDDQVKMAQHMHKMMDKMSSMNMDDFMSMMRSMHGESHEDMKMHGDKKMHGDMMKDDKRHGDKRMHGEKKMHGDAKGEMKQGDYHGDKKYHSMQDMMLNGVNDPEIRGQMTAEMQRHYQTMLELVEAGVDDPEIKAKLVEKIQKHLDKANS